MWCFRSAVLLLFFILAGCQNVVNTLVELPPLPLLAPASLAQEWQISQSVKILPPDKSTPPPILAAWSVHDQVLVAAALSPEGQKLLAIAYDGQQLSAQRLDQLPDTLRGRDIIAQLQLSYWPLSAWQTALRGSDWQLKASDTERQLYFKNEWVMTVYRNFKDQQPTLSDRVIIETRAYTLHIDTLSMETLGNPLPGIPRENLIL